MTTLEVLPNEGAHEGRRIYRDAWLYLALQSISAGDYATALSHINSSKQWHENLGVGKPYDEDIDLRSENFLTAYCYEKMNDRTQAAEYFGKVTSQTGFNANELLSAYALWRGNNRLAAGQRMASYAKHADNKDIANWCQSVFNSNFTGTSENIAISGQEQVAAWERSIADVYFDVVRKIVSVCK